MAFPAPQVGDLIEFKLVYFVNEQTCMNIFHYTVGSRTAGSGGPTLLDVAKAIGLKLWDDATNGLAFCVTTDVVNIAYSAQIIKPARTVAAVADPITNTTGFRDSPTMPSGVSVVVQKKGILALRSNQGRNYVAGIASNDVSGSMLVPLSLTDVAFESFTAQPILSINIIVGGVTLVLAPVLCPLPAGTPLVVVSLAGYDRTIRYQRRRELRVGV